MFRGRAHRNSIAGIAQTSHITLRRNATQLIEDERVKFQKLAKHRFESVQAIKHDTKENLRSVGGGLAPGSPHSPKRKKRVAERVDEDAEHAMQLAKQLRDSITPAHRPCWWTPTQNRVTSCGR